MNHNDKSQEEHQDSSILTLYEQAQRMWKDLVFDILLEPLDPQSGEIAERRIIDFRSCEYDINNPRNIDDLVPLNELVGELPDYNKLVESSNLAMDLIKDQYKDKYKVTLQRVLHQQIGNEEEPDAEPEQESEEEPEYESEPESEDYSTNSEVESDFDASESEPEWEDEWQTDSGRETELDGSTGPPSESEDEYESDWEIDSGRPSESESEWGLEPSYEDSSSSDNDDEDSEYPQLIFPFTDIIIIGPHGTRVSRGEFEAVPWDNPIAATKALLSLIFGEYILAISTPFHGALPEFQGLAGEGHQLNPQYIADIVGLISCHYKISQQEVHSIIHAKCAEAKNVYDENQMRN